MGPLTDLSDTVAVDGADKVVAKGKASLPRLVPHDSLLGSAD